MSSRLAEEEGADARTPSRATSASPLERALERELIAKCRAGDSRFYEPLVRAYEPSALRVAQGILGSGDDALDAVQDAFINAFQALGSFDAKRRFGPWFFQILRNRCRDVLRARASRGRREIRDVALEEQAGDGEYGPERQRERRAAAELVWRALQQLGEEHREILVLKELEGFRYHEIAAIVGIPEGTVASRLFHARRELKRILDSLGADYP